MRVSPLEGHRIWAPFYDSGANPILALEERSMGPVLNALKPASMIDAGCGTGRWLLRFQKAGTHVFGVDLCEQMLAEAAKHPRLCGRLMLGSADSLPFPSASADLVLCSMALGYFDYPAKVFHEFARVLNPGGCVAVSDLHPRAIAAGWTRSFKVGPVQYNLKHRSYSLEELEQNAKIAGLRTVRKETVVFGDPEFPIFMAAGKGHLFSALRNIPALFIRLWEKPC